MRKETERERETVRIPLRTSFVQWRGALPPYTEFIIIPVCGVHVQLYCLSLIVHQWMKYLFSVTAVQYSWILVDAQNIYVTYPLWVYHCRNLCMSSTNRRHCLPILILFFFINFFFYNFHDDIRTSILMVNIVWHSVIRYVTAILCAGWHLVYMCRGRTILVAHRCTYRRCWCRCIWLRAQVNEGWWHRPAGKTLIHDTCAFFFYRIKWCLL